MKRQKNCITYEEYEGIIKQLELVEQEIASLNQIKELQNYNEELKLPNYCDILIITLKRDNDSIKHEIELEKKKFLINFYTSNDLYLKIKRKIEQLIFICLNNENFSKNKYPDTELIPILMNYPNFELFLDKLLDLSSKHNSNLYLLQYIQDLQSKQEELKRKEHLYKKQHKRKKSKNNF